MNFSGKKYPHKTKSICLVMRFSPETTEKTNMKKQSRLCSKIFFWLLASALRLIVAFDSVKTLFDVCLMQCLKNITIFRH